MAAAADGRFVVGEGEEARLTPAGPYAAEVWSRGFLPLRVRTESSYRLRPAFPGTAVVLGDETFEVLAEMELPQQGLVVYRLRPWPEGEVVRDRVVYGRAFVRAAEEERARARGRERARPFRFVLYPLVGLLPEDMQERLCDHLGLYSVTATLVSGLVESLGTLALLALVARASETSRPVAVAALVPSLLLLVMPGLGRAFSAFFLRETGGSVLVAGLFNLLRALGAVRARYDRSFVPLTREGFWERLRRPDGVETGADGMLVYRGLIAHLTWDASRRLQAGSDYWAVEPLPPGLERGRLVFRYRLCPLGETPGVGEPPPGAPSPLAYADEVMGEVRYEWDAFNEAFAWLTCLLAAEVQERAFDHRGGPAAVRRPTLWTAGAGAVLGLYLLSFLPGPAGDPLAPLVGLLAVALVADAVRRFRAARGGRYAPSLFRFLLPSDSLRPERLAFHAHRDAERAALALIADRVGAAPS